MHDREADSPSPDSTEEGGSIDAFVENVDLERRCSAREVVELMRARLPSVDERVEDGMAVFSRSGVDITGVSISDSHISLYVPDSQVVEKFSSKLGNVECETSRVQFGQLTDINRAELRRMIDSLDDGDQNSDPES